MNGDDAALLTRHAEATARVLARHRDLAVDASVIPARDTMIAEAVGAAVGAGDDAAMARALRRLKYRVVGGLILRDFFGGPAAFPPIGQALADLADALLEGALIYAREALRAAHGDPPGWGDGGFVIIAMGKHGGRELNYASDIDLVYVARDLSGETGGPRSIASGRYAERLAARLRALVADPTEDGFGFRVDLDLRPDGASGPPVASIGLAEHHYLHWGRTWERAAWLKARPCAGDLALGDELLRRIEPFRFRRTLDFGTLDDLAAMHDRIVAQAGGDEAIRDLKRGPGGIRQIEFLVQATQLAWCGRDPSLRQAATLPALHALARRGVLPAGVDPASLEADYLFLRALEHRLQWPAEAQTQSLPRDDAGWLALADAMATPLPALRDRLAAVRDRVLSAWALTFPSRPPAPDSALVDPFASPDETAARLRGFGFVDAVAAAERLSRLSRPSALRGVHPSTFRIWERLAPRMVRLAGSSADPDAALARVEAFVDRAGARRGVYSLLDENAGALETLLRLFAESAFLSDRLIAHPELLDALVLRGRGGESGPRTEEALAADLLGEIGALTDDDARLATLRVLRTVEWLRIGLLDLSGALPDRMPGRWLNAVARACVRGASRIARDAVADRAGIAASEPLPLAAIGFGSLGSGWTTYGSDLDLAFVFDPAGLPDDPRTIASRWAQRVVTALTASTREGACYAVDLRLRPGGSGGPVVVTLDGFRDYYRLRAHPWERIALARADRVASEDPAFGEAVGAALIEAKGVAAEGGPALVAEAERMRGRQRSELAKDGGSVHDLKLGDGGISDAEFAIACVQATRPVSHPARAEPDPARAVSLLAPDPLDPAVAKALGGAIRSLRRVEATLRLQSGTPSAVLDTASPQGARLARALGFGDGSALDAMLHATRDVVRDAARATRAAV